MIEKKSIKFVVFILLLIISFSAAYSQGQWKFRKEKYNTKAFTRSHPDYSINEYKIETEIETTIEDILSIMTEESTYSKMFKDIKNLKFFNKREDYFELYLVNNAPFPARDRDGFFVSQFSYDSLNHTARIDITCPQSDHHQKKYIELTRCKGHWEFQQIEENKVKLTHQFIGDPGGFVPAFILNMVLVNNPLTTIRDLNKILNSGDYTRRKFTFISTEPKN